MSDFFAANLGAAPAGGNVLDWSSLVASEAKPAEATWTVPEAFFAILFSAATCEGVLRREEEEELLALVHRSRALKTLTQKQLEAINVSVARRLAGADALRQACAALPQDMRLTAFAHALDLVLADGELSAEEADYLNTLILHLGLAGPDVERVSEVITLKNRY